MAAEESELKEATDTREDSESIYDAKAGDKSTKDILWGAAKDQVSTLEPIVSTALTDYQTAKSALPQAIAEEATSRTQAESAATAETNAETASETATREAQSARASANEALQTAQDALPALESDQEMKSKESEEKQSSQNAADLAEAVALQELNFAKQEHDAANEDLKVASDDATTKAGLAAAALATLQELQSQLPNGEEVFALGME